MLLRKVCIHALLAHMGRVVVAPQLTLRSMFLFCARVFSSSLCQFVHLFVILALHQQLSIMYTQSTVDAHVTQSAPQSSA